MTEFYFIRHGQTTANVQGLKQGTINTPITNLTEQGKRQAQNLHEHFPIDFADQIIVSPLQRTKDTASIINQDAHLQMTIDERLLEISYGNWDGKKNADLKAQHPEVFDNELNDVLPNYAPLADGETFKAVTDRVQSFMSEYANNYPDQKIIVVTHGFTIKAAMMAAMGTGPDPMLIAEPDNTSVTHIILNNKYYIREYNQTF